MNVLALDSETLLFRPGYMAPEVVCATYAAIGDTPFTSNRFSEPTLSRFPLARDRGITAGIFAGADLEGFFGTALEWAEKGRGENLLVGSNVAYDLGCVLEHYPHLAANVFGAYDAGAVLCTHVVEKLLDIAVFGELVLTKKYSLAELSRDYLSTPMDKDTWRLRYHELIDTPLDLWPPGALDYAISDAVTSLEVFLCQLAKAQKMAYALPDAPEQCRADFALRLTSAWGLRTDPERVAALDKKTGEAMNELRQKLVGHGYYLQTEKVQRKSVLKMREHVSQLYGGKPPRTALGQVSLAWETLDDVRKESSVVDDWLSFTELEKSAGTYISHLWEGIEVPIHPRFNVLVGTGRTSCSKPNVQQLPRIEGVRECYRARPGYVYLSVDYSAQEMRTWAQACVTLCGFSSLAERYQVDPDFDPHLAMAAKALLRISEEDAAKTLTSPDKNAAKEVKKARQSAKIANFGLPGGMGVGGLIRYARGYGQHWEEPLTCPGCATEKGGMRATSKDHNCFAARLRQGWFDTWPEARAYFDVISSLPGVPDGEGTQVFLVSQRRRGHVGYCNASNGFFQGLASDISKAALYEVVRRCFLVESSALYGTRPNAFVHDEVFAETPEERAHEAALEMTEVMESVMQKFTPDVPARASPALMRWWSKDAELVMKNGRTMPWEDRLE